VTVVELIGVKHDDLTWCADLTDATIVKREDAVRRQTNSVGVVAVLVIGGSVQPGFQEFNPVLRVCTTQPIRCRLAARSFKTDTAGLPIMALHKDRFQPFLDEREEQL
jgi:hypothetical protein